MSRFPEPDDFEPQVVTYCCGCGEELYEGQEVIQFDDEHFCDMYCLMNEYNIQEITLEGDQ